MLLPFGIISDTHLHNWSTFATVNSDGVNTRLAQILNEIRRAAIMVKSIGGKRLYHGGDLFHVRGSIPPSVLNPTIDAFRSIVDETGVEIRIIAGNHDLESADSSQLGNAAASLRSIDGVEIVSKGRFFSDDRVVMLPWRDKMDDLRNDLSETKARCETVPGGVDHTEWTVIIHAPVNGVIMGIPDHGFDGDELEAYGFKAVFAGHYHDHKAVAENVYSIGATTHQTWGDVGSKAGHLLVKQSPFQVEHCRTHAPEFIDFDTLEIDEGDHQAAEIICDNYLRIKMDEVTESEIREFREIAVNDWGAAGVIIKSTPKPETSRRKGVTATSGETLMGSVQTWIDANEIKSAKVDLAKECESILSEAEAE